MTKFLKRIGTKKIIYEYEILIERIDIKLPAPCQLSILMKRGHRKAETQRKLNYDPKKGFVLAEEALLMKASLFLNIKNNKYLDKFAHFYIKVVTGKSSKSGGEKKVNLSYYPNNNINQRTEILSMEKGIDGGCKLHLNIKCNKLGEAQENDSDSDASEKSQTSRSDVSFDKELEDPTKTEEREKKLNTSPSKNNVLIGKVTPPRSPKVVTPRSNTQDKNDKFGKINEKNDKNINIIDNKFGKNIEKYDKNEKNDKNTERNDKNIDQYDKPIDNYEKNINKNDKNIKNIDKYDKNIIDKYEKNIDKYDKKDSPSNNYSDNKQILTKIEKTQSTVIPTRKIFEPAEKKIVDNTLPQPKQTNLSKSQDPRNPIIPQNSSFKQAFEINPNLKPPATKLLKFDDDELDDQHEEEKLPNFGGPGSSDYKSNNYSNQQKPEINKFSFSSKPQEILKKTPIIQNKSEEDDEEDDDDKPIILHTVENQKKDDKELEYLDKILEFEKDLRNKNLKIEELFQKIDDLQKKNEELKQMAYKANKEGGMSSRGIQAEYEKMKIALKESEDKRQAFMEETRTLTNKYKKLELDYKNVLSDYEAVSQEQKQHQENLYNLQGQKETIESTNKSYSLELKNHKDKIVNLTTEVARLRDELKRSADENANLQQKIDSSQFAIETKEKELEKWKNQSNSLNNLNDTTFRELQLKNESLIKDLRNQIRIAEGQKEEALSSQTKLALELQNLKIEREQLKVRLENRLQSINDNDESLNEKATYLEKDNINLKKKLNKLQAEFTSEKEELNTMIEQLQEELKAKRNELFDLERAKKDLETELIGMNGRGSRAGEINEGLEGLKQNFEKQMRILKKTLENKDITLKQKEEELRKMEEELNETNLQLKRLDFKKNRDSTTFDQITDEELRQKNEELELKLLNKEEEYIEKFENMQKEIESLKMQAIEGHSKVSINRKTGGDKDEMEVAALSVENQKLKKMIKELQNKGGTSSGGNKGFIDDGVFMRENEMLKKKNKDLEGDKQKLADELINLKMNNANYDNNKEINSKVLSKYTKQIKQLEVTLKAVEMELLKSKQRIGDAINAAMDIGGPDLVDKITSVMK